MGTLSLSWSLPALARARWMVNNGAIVEAEGVDAL